MRKIFEVNNIQQDELFGKIITLLDSEERVCSICTSFYNNPVVLTCNHIYCASCIFNWITKQHSKFHHQHAKCPLCKTPIDMKGLNLISKTETEPESKVQEESKSSESSGTTSESLSPLGPSVQILSSILQVFFLPQFIFS